MEGYGLYWYCLELIAQTVEVHNLTFELEHDAELISMDTGIHQERVQEMMTDFVKWGLFENNQGVLTCLKMASRTDEYTQKLLRTNSGRTPDKIPPNRREEKRIERNPPKPTDLDNGFNGFWETWPKKVDKKDAETAWKNLSKTKREAALIDSRTRYSGTEKQFIPSPAKYLRKEKWIDERFEQSEKTKTEREWVAYGQQQGIEPKRGETNSDYAARVKKITEDA